MKAAPPLALATLLATHAFGAIAAADAPPASPAADPAADQGPALFRQYCTSCHGESGRGDGPVAASLKQPPADLTRIAARAGGRFDADAVRQMIDGRAPLPAHGPREMPVWGYELEARAPDAAPGRATAQALTDRLVEYLRTLQR